MTGEGARSRGAALGSEGSRIASRSRGPTRGRVEEVPDAIALRPSRWLVLEDLGGVGLQCAHARGGCASLERVARARGAAAAAAAQLERAAAAPDRVARARASAAAAAAADVAHAAGRARGRGRGRSATRSIEADNATGPRG